MEEVVDIEELNASVSEREFEPSCYYSGFNGPIDPGFCLTAQSTNSSDPLTLSQACKRPDWKKWETAIQEEFKSLQDFRISTPSKLSTYPQVKSRQAVNMFSKQNFTQMDK